MKLFQTAIEQAEKSCNMPPSISQTSQRGTPSMSLKVRANGSHIDKRDADTGSLSEH